MLFRSVALANIDIIEREKLPENAQNRGLQLLIGLKTLESHEHVGNVRGKGLMAFVEVVAEKALKTAYDAASGIGGKLQAATRKRGLITRCSDVGIAIAPPLVISRAEVDELVNIVAESIHEVCV